MELIKVSKKMDIYHPVKDLYIKSFPAEERAPFWLMMKKTSMPIVDFWALYDDDNWVGIAYVIKNENIAYLFYLAICENERGKGYGHKSLEILKEKYKDYKFFLALEELDKNADNYEQRVKRHSFYESCGLSDMPHHIKEASVVYDIMGIGEPVTAEEYLSLMKKYLGRFLVKILDIRIVE